MPERKIRCPKCQFQFEVAAAESGERLKCPGCGKKIRLEKNPAGSNKRKAAAGSAKPVEPERKGESAPQPGAKQPQRWKGVKPSKPAVASGNAAAASLPAAEKFYRGKCHECQGDFRAELADQPHSVACPHCNAAIAVPSRAEFNAANRGGAGNAGLPVKVVGPAATQSVTLAPPTPPQVAPPQVAPPPLPAAEPPPVPDANSPAAEAPLEVQIRTGREKKKTVQVEDADLLPPMGPADAESPRSATGTAGDPAANPATENAIPATLAAASTAATSPSSGPSAGATPGQPAQPVAAGPIAPSGAEQAGSEAPKLAANQRLAELLARLPPQFIDPSVAEKKKNVVLIPDATGGFTELPADVTHVAYAGTKVAVKQGLSTSGKLMQAVWRMIVFLMCAVMLMIVYYLLT